MFKKLMLLITILLGMQLQASEEKSSGNRIDNILIQAFNYAVQPNSDLAIQELLALNGNQQSYCSKISEVVINEDNLNRKQLAFLYFIKALIASWQNAFGREREKAYYQKALEYGFTTSANVDPFDMVRAYYKLNDMYDTNKPNNTDELLRSKQICETILSIYQHHSELISDSCSSKLPAVCLRSTEQTLERINRLLKAKRSQDA